MVEGHHRRRQGIAEFARHQHGQAVERGRSQRQQCGGLKQTAAGLQHHHHAAKTQQHRGPDLPGRMLAQQRRSQRGHKQRYGEIQRHRIGQRQGRKSHVVGGVRAKHDDGAQSQRAQVRGKNGAPTAFALHQVQQNRTRHAGTDEDHLGQRIAAADLFDDGVLRREHKHAQAQIQNTPCGVVVVGHGALGWREQCKCGLQCTARLVRRHPVQR